jgi:hypothetical protein
MAAERRRILILCKTYPSPSAKYVETSCVAGMDDAGQLVRLFPVPFRMVEDERQFRKWQWISARVRHATDDRRPESHRLSVDTIELHGEPLSTRDAWAERRQAIDRVEVIDDFADLERARLDRGVSLGLVRPGRLISMDITPASSPEWSDDEIAKLMQAQLQGSLFDELAEQRSLKTLKKLPFDFHYRYQCGSADRAIEHRHKLVDWEAGALYWNICRRPDWQSAFRQKFMVEFSEKDVLFLMGTIHRFPHQWLIVSVLYPPKRPTDLAGQQSLF